MQRKEIEELLERYAAGAASLEERILVETWYLKHEPALSQVTSEHILQDQQESLKQLLADADPRHKRNLWPAVAAAASLLIFLSIGGYYFLKPDKQPLLITQQLPGKADLLPGGNKAIITLANGNVVFLTGAKHGLLASQGNTRISQTSDGQVRYDEVGNKNPSGQLVYNTASTPCGGQYQFTLADGTKVWLNAASSIKFPVAFNGRERKVELSGEAYFEVVHNAQKPFKVVTNGQTIEDLGTHFNVNAYTDEAATKTTLLEGSVKIYAGSESRIIKPGEQAQLKSSSIEVTSVDTEGAIAWKNGLFHFDNNSIQEVARQLARWYDVDIRYEGQLPSRSFSGEISRNVNASQILDILSFKKVHYRIDGKTIVILP